MQRNKNKELVLYNEVNIPHLDPFVSILNQIGRFCAFSSTNIDYVKQNSRDGACSVSLQEISKTLFVVIFSLVFFMFFEVWVFSGLHQIPE